MMPLDQNLFPRCSAIKILETLPKAEAAFEVEEDRDPDRPVVPLNASERPTNGMAVTYNSGKEDELIRYSLPELNKSIVFNCYYVKILKLFLFFKFGIIFKVIQSKLLQNTK